MDHRALFAIGLSVLLMPRDARAQWEAIPLHPLGEGSSFATSISGTTIGGSVIAPGPNQPDRPVIWDARTGQLTALNELGRINAVDGEYQLGGARLWHGPGSTPVSLLPTGYPGAEGLGAGGGQQVGWVSSGGVIEAALWTGTAASFVNLNPATATRSVAQATDGQRQAGWARLPAGGGFERSVACVWSGTAGSFVSLNPGPQYESKAYGAGGGQVVGTVLAAGIPDHAALWTNGPESLIDLHPLATGDSFAFATNGQYQVGDVGLRAALWAGTAASYVDLSQFLPPEFTRSAATGVSEVNGVIYVSVNASRFTGDPNRAFLIRSIPGPGGLAAFVPCLSILIQRRRRA